MEEFRRWNIKGCRYEIW